MKNVLLIFVFALFAQLAWAQAGIEFFHGTYNEAIARAKAEDKLIFVDAYAKWCGPCKRMAATVFVDTEVGNFMNANFISMKLDMEEEESLDFGGEYPVSAYPTMFYINPKDRSVVKKQVGGLSVEQFLEVGKAAIGSVDNSKEFAERWDKGEKTPDVALGYIKGLNRSGKPSLKIANEFLQQNKVLDTDAKLEVLFESLTEADSRIYDIFIKNRKTLEKLKGAPACTQRITQACKRTAQKAKEFKSDELWQESLVKMRSDAPLEADIFEAEMGMSYYESQGDAAKYLKACKSYTRLAKTDASRYERVAKQVLRAFGGDKACVKEAEAMAEIATKLAPDNAQYWFTLAQVQLKNGNKSDALGTAKKAKALADDNTPQLAPQIQQWIEANKLI